VAQDPAAFWRVKGARELGPGQAAVLRELFAYREQQAERADVPPFKVMGEATLLELARLAPRQAADLSAVAGMTPEQIRRHGEGVLRAIEAGLQAPGQVPPELARESDEVSDRYDRQHTWRKTTARKRGVESDVILPRTTLWDLARRVPRTIDDLAQVADFGPWRREKYGKEILALLSRAGGSN
jgi:ribonuclease D